MVQPKIAIVPITVPKANQFVAAWHRHHAPLPGGFAWFCVAAVDTGRICGVAIAGRPTNRNNDASLRAAGWTREEGNIRSWWGHAGSRTPAVAREHLAETKTRWVRYFREGTTPVDVVPEPEREAPQLSFPGGA